MGNTIIKCLECGDTREHHAKGLCYRCYRRGYHQKKIICSNCKRYKEKHVDGLCTGCYNTLKMSKYNANLSLSKKYCIEVDDVINIRKTGCIICGWKKKIHIHHRDQNKDNNNISNLFALCPNHHFALHSKDFQDETINELRSVGVEHHKVIVQVKS